MLREVRRYNDIKNQRNKRRDEPKDNADGKCATDVNEKRRVGQYKDGPGHVEEEDVERGRPCSERRGEKIGHDGF